MPTNDRPSRDRDEFGRRRAARDRSGRRGDPFAEWLQQNDLDDSEEAWWERPDDPPMLPNAPNWKPGTIIGHLLPAQHRGALYGESRLRWSHGIDNSLPMRDPFAAFGLREHINPPTYDDDALDREARAHFNDWADEEQRRRTKKAKQKPKRQRRDDSSRDRRR